jgi:hypothetical protein
LDLEVRRFGTAMESSNWFRRGALAPAGIEIGPTPGTEPRTIVAAEKKCRHRERQFLPHYPPEIHRACAGGEHVYRRIVIGVWIVAEEDVQILVDVVDHVGQAAPTTGIDIGGDPSPPKVLTRAGCLEASGHRHRPREPQLESFEDRIVRLEPPDRVDRTPAESAEVDLKHSRIN